MIPLRRGQLTFEGAIVPPSRWGCRGTMIVSMEDIDPCGAPTLHYVRLRPPRACLVLSVFYEHFEHGVAPCGGIISDIRTFSRTEKSRGKKIHDILTSFFRARKLLSLVAHIRVRFENTIAGLYNY